jgi:hypothetical protein
LTGNCILPIQDPGRHSNVPTKTKTSETGHMPSITLTSGRKRFLFMWRTHSKPHFPVNVFYLVSQRPFWSFQTESHIASTFNCFYLKVRDANANIRQWTTSFNKLRGKKSGWTVLHAGIQELMQYWT